MSEIGVWSEIAPLKKLLIWGEPGCETALGQLLPENESLFYEDFDVYEGRSEYRKMKDMLTERGAELVSIKAAFVDTLRGKPLPPQVPQTIGELGKLMEARAEAYYEKYHIGNVDKVKGWIPKLLEEDLNEYKDERAVILANWYLSLVRGDVKLRPPMANMFYSRDQSNVIGDRIVMSRMRYPIRKLEPSVYMRAYERLGLEGAIVTPTEGTIEGGDTIILGDTCYVGVAVRTSREAVASVFEQIGERLAAKGIVNVVAVVNEKLVELNKTVGDKPGYSDMNSMHLDTFWTPLREDLVLACGDETKDRTVEQLKMVNGKVEFINLGPFDKYMEQKGIKVLDVSRQEQHDYATNLLHLGGNVVMVPLEKNTRVIDMLRGAGFEVLTPDIKELVGGYGAVHCMTASIVRG